MTTSELLLVDLFPLTVSSRSMQAYDGSAAQSALSAAVARRMISFGSAACPAKTNQQTANICPKALPPRFIGFNHQMRLYFARLQCVCLANHRLEQSTDSIPEDLHPDTDED